MSVFEKIAGAAGGLSGGLGQQLGPQMQLQASPTPDRPLTERLGEACTNLMQAQIDLLAAYSALGLEAPPPHIPDSTDGVKLTVALEANYLLSMSRWVGAALKDLLTQL